MTMVEGSNVVDPGDQFPIGMRVLAVDDDPICLMVLETLLRRCQYNVTVTKHAVTALKLLRENKNKFDLVISDVVMPDMDGFKLLQHVRIEMDLPVIMLSANDDPKMVMKGITHGACDYLLKPIRIEELKNIWQHVMRRKCNAIESTETGNSNQNGKLTKKRKTRDEDGAKDHGNSHDDEEPSTHKKTRVAWSAELHSKFVAAVNQLGIEKAVPKKILDLMNVESLTRENVASHLQKYRLYLKRVSCVINQQPNMVAALGSFGPFQSSFGSGQFHNNSFRSFPINMSNTPIGLKVHGFPSSGTHHNGVQGIGGSSSLVSGTSNNVLMLKANPQGSQGGGLSENSNSVASQHSEFSVSLVDNGRSNDIWSTAVQTFKRNYYIPSESFRDASMPSQGVFSTNSQTPANGAADPEGYTSTNSTFNRNLDVSFCDPLQMKHAEMMEFNEENSLKPHQVYTMNQQKSQDSCVDDNLGSLDDIIIAMMNEKDDEVTLLDGDFFCDIDYPGWTSM